MTVGGDCSAFEFRSRESDYKQSFIGCATVPQTTEGLVELTTTLTSSDECVEVLLISSACKAPSSAGCVC